MKIIGIDPGLRTVGIGIIEALSPQDIRVVEWLTIETPSTHSSPQRLKEIHQDLHEVLEQHHPSLAVVEKLFFETNVKTAMDVSQARGVILLTLAECSIPILEPTPLQLKAAMTGDGKADKRQMQDMLKHILRLDSAPRPDDAADALALAVYGALVNEKVFSL